MPDYSVSPTGEKFPLPAEGEFAAEFGRVQALAKAARAQKREVVVVMGVGFVGAVMAAVVADARDARSGQPTKFVIGMQRPEPAQLLEDPHAQPRASRRSRPRTPRSTRSSPAACWRRRR